MHLNLVPESRVSDIVGSVFSNRPLSEKALTTTTLL